MATRMTKSKPARNPQFGELPPQARRGPKPKVSAWVPVLRKLMVRPDEWALIGQTTAGNLASLKRIARKLGVFEFTTRATGNGKMLDVWARYDGPLEAPAQPVVPDVDVVPWVESGENHKTWTGSGHDIGSFPEAEPERQVDQIEKPLHGLTTEPLTVPPAWRPAMPRLA
jgi:hypothetical protein